MLRDESDHGMQSNPGAQGAGGNPPQATFCEIPPVEERERCCCWQKRSRSGTTGDGDQPHPATAARRSLLTGRIRLRERRCRCDASYEHRAASTRVQDEHDARKLPGIGPGDYRHAHEIVVSSPGEFAKRIVVEIEKWRKVVQSNNIKVEF